MTENRTKSQHYVPRMHLRPFVGSAPANMIWTFDTERDRWRPSIVEKTGAQTNFYSIRQDDGTYLDDIDRWLTGAENKVSLSYPALVGGHVPNGQERADLAVFIAALYCRSPAFVRQYAHAKAQHAQVMNNFLTSSRAVFEAQMDRFERAEGPLAIAREQLWAFQSDPSKYYIGVSEKAGLKGLTVIDDLAPIFYNRRWAFLEAPPGSHFITSDNPVYRFVPQEDRLGIMGDGGFINPRAEVTVPLSPTLALIILEDAQDGMIVPVSAGYIDQFNMARAAYAERYLYTHRKDGRVAAWGRELANHKQRMVVGGGDNVEIKITR